MMIHRQGKRVIFCLALCVVPAIAWGQGFHYQFSPGHGIRIQSPFFQFRLDSVGPVMPFSTGVIVPWNSPPWEPSWPGHLRSFSPYRPQQNFRPELGAQSPVAERLIAACELLAGSLKRHPQGESWLEFLGPMRIRDFARQSLKEPVSEKARTQFRQLLTHYTGTENSAEFKWVVRLPGFMETKSLLDELIANSTNSESEPLGSQPSFAPVPLEPGTSFQRHPESRLEPSRQESDPRPQAPQSMEELPRPPAIDLHPR
jgi:hypothetical protein